MTGPVDHPAAGTVTRADLADRVHDLGFSRRESTAHVRCILDLVCDALARGEPVKLSGFGKFEVKDKEARVGRNPHTGERLRLDARRVVVFRPSPKLRDALTEALEPPEAP